MKYGQTRKGSTLTPGSSIQSGTRWQIGYAPGFAIRGPCSGVVGFDSHSRLSPLMGRFRLLGKACSCRKSTRAERYRACPSTLHAGTTGGRREYYFQSPASARGFVRSERQRLLAGCKLSVHPSWHMELALCFEHIGYCEELDTGILNPVVFKHTGRCRFLPLRLRGRNHA